MIEDIKKAVQEISKYAYKPDFSNIEVVKYNLVFLYQVMLATTGMLEEAILHSDGELQEYFTKHLEEDRHHAEWLAEDLLYLSIDVTKELTKRQSAAMAGAQYYLIKHIRPECLLGYMAVIEGFPIDINFVENMENLHGKEAFRTLRLHAEEDITHAKELFEIIEKYQCSEILENSIQTQLYLNELSNVLRMQ